MLADQKNYIFAAFKLVSEITVMEKLFTHVLKIKWIIILLVVATTVFLAIQIPKIRINSDVISSLPDSDKDAVLLKKIGAGLQV